jgi:hypothetical protein
MDPAAAPAPAAPETTAAPQPTSRAAAQDPLVTSALSAEDDASDEDELPPLPVLPDDSQLQRVERMLVPSAALATAYFVAALAMPVPFYVSFLVFLFALSSWVSHMVRCTATPSEVDRDRLGRSGDHVSRRAITLPTMCSRFEGPTRRC